MEQRALAFVGKGGYGMKEIGAVTLDRQDEAQIILRFLGTKAAWGQPGRQIRLDIAMAEELRRLLNAELSYNAADDYPDDGSWSTDGRDNLTI